MNHFEKLYDLSIELLTAPPTSALGRLTFHHGHSNEEAEAIVREAVLTREMPSESPTNRWGILRVFMLNLVNRSQAPMTSEGMLRCLDQATLLVPDDASRTVALTNAVAGNLRLSQSLSAVLERGHAPDGCNNYLDWLALRIEEYSQLPLQQLDVDRVLGQLHCIASNPKTKIPNMGLALAANLFADLGIRVVGKPDLHVLPTIKGLLGVDSLTPENCVREVIRMAGQDAPMLAANARFAWLTGGLYPRDIDRMIYLIGSDNFRLGGRRMKKQAPRRRDLMLKTLIAASQTTGAKSLLPQTPTYGTEHKQTRTRPDRKLSVRPLKRVIGHTAREQFFDGLGSAMAARTLIDRVTSLCGELRAQLHHTHTRGGDLRVKADRQQPHPHEQNVIVMTWVPTLGYFSCQTPLLPQECIDLGFSANEVRSNTGPLSTRFNVRPGRDDALFVSVVHQSIQRFRGT